MVVVRALLGFIRVVLPRSLSLDAGWVAHSVPAATTAAAAAASTAAAAAAARAVNGLWVDDLDT